MNKEERQADIVAAERGMSEDPRSFRSTAARTIAICGDCAHDDNPAAPAFKDDDK
jgi:hypothetical protein